MSEYFLHNLRKILFGGGNLVVHDRDIDLNFCGFRNKILYFWGTKVYNTPWPENRLDFVRQVLAFSERSIEGAV